MTFDQWMESLGDEEAIPSDHSSFAYARDAGIPYDWLHLAWVAFERRYTGDKKRYTDWRRVFRNAVEGNWMKIWWVKDGQYFLGTVGQQVMNIRTTAESSQAKPA